MAAGVVLMIVAVVEVVVASLGVEISVHTELVVVMTYLCCVSGWPKVPVPPGPV